MGIWSRGCWRDTLHLMPFPLLAVSDLALGWLAVVLLSLIAAFGWIVGLAMLAGGGLRKTLNPLVGLLLVLLLSGGLILTPFSLGMTWSFAMRAKQAAAATEARKAQRVE